MEMYPMPDKTIESLLIAEVDFTDIQYAIMGTRLKYVDRQHRR